MLAERTRGRCHLLSFYESRWCRMSSYEIIMVILTGIGLLVVLIDKIGKK